MDARRNHDPFKSQAGVCAAWVLGHEEADQWLDRYHPSRSNDIVAGIMVMIYFNSD